MRVLFWGTPEFAVPALRALSGEGFDVVGVVTQPDKPVGRSRSQVHAPPVKRVAVEEGYPVLQPSRPAGAEFLDALRALAPDISVVVAYGHILSTQVIDLPTRGTINIHASLLPKLRGAAPIQAAIRDGLTETGVSIMRMVQALDAGPVIHRVRTPIPGDETYGELSLHLAEIGALALVEAMTLIELGKATEDVQDESAATYAPKITRTMTAIDWTTDARSLASQVRAYDPTPGALARHRGADVKMYGARVAPSASAARPGEVVRIGADGMFVACGTGAVQIVDVQPAGKRRMTPADWERGRGIAIGERLS